MLLELLLLDDKVLVFLPITRGLRQVIDPEIHVDAWLCEFELVDHVGRTEEPTLLLAQLLCFRLSVETLLELHQLGPEGVSVG